MDMSPSRGSEGLFILQLFLLLQGGKNQTIFDERKMKNIFKITKKKIEETIKLPQRDCPAGLEDGWSEDDHSDVMTWMTENFY